MFQRFPTTCTVPGVLSRSDEGRPASDADPRNCTVGPNTAHDTDDRHQQGVRTPPEPDHQGTSTSQMPTPAMEARGDGPAPPRAWIWPWVWPLAYLPFRLLVSAAAVLLFDQAVFAGQFLSGTFGALHTHRENATVAGLVVVGAALAAIPIRWPGHGPIWPLFACVGLFGLIALQITLGFRRELTVHVPLGVSIIVLASLLAIWAWKPHRVSHGALARVTMGADR
jgi:hypothetical protein